MNGVSFPWGQSVFALVGVLAVCGCSPAVSEQNLAEFECAGPVKVQLDVEKIVQAKVPTKAYCAVPGDVLALDLPAGIRATNYRRSDQGEPTRYRVSKEGTITLPVVKAIPVAGKTLAEIEGLVVEAFYPKFVVEPPTVVAQVADYHSVYVSIIGAVARPGIYTLRSDELTLVAILMKAGGITPEGAAAIRISRPEGDGNTETVVLPVKGVNVPFADVPLQGGETVEVVKINPQIFTVVGLVASPGTYPLSLDLNLNLIQAIHLAGGPDQFSDPRYATVYRQDARGQIISARFRLGASRSPWLQWDIVSDTTLGDGSFIGIKPGDVIFVEKDARTRAREVLVRAVYLSIGASAGAHGSATYSRDFSPPAKTTE